MGQYRHWLLYIQIRYAHIYRSTCNTIEIASCTTSPVGWMRVMRFCPFLKQMKAKIRHNCYVLHLLFAGCLHPMFYCQESPVSIGLITVFPGWSHTLTSLKQIRPFPTKHHIKSLCLLSKVLWCFMFAAFSSVPLSRFPGFAEGDLCSFPRAFVHWGTTCFHFFDMFNFNVFCCVPRKKSQRSPCWKMVLRSSCSAPAACCRPCPVSEKRRWLSPG